MRSKQLAFLLLLPVLLLAACSGNSNKFTVSGKIENMPEQSVYLEELTINEIVIVDSTKSDKDGSFKLAGNAQEPGLYRLRFQFEKYILLSVEEGDINISGDWATLENYKVEGSQPSKSLQEFLVRVREQMRDFNTMSIIMDTLQERGSDSALLSAKADFQEMNMQFTRYIEVYADTTQNLPNALFAVQMLNPQVESEYLASFIESMNTRFPKAKMAKEFTVKYNQMMAVQNTPTGSGPAIGNMAPEINLQTPDGKTVMLSSMRGKYVLVDFWASWCSPCRQENPNVVAAYNKYKDKNFTILGVSLDNDKDKWQNAIEKDALTWTHISDLKGWESIAARDYEVQSIPANFLVDPNGKIVARDLRGIALEDKLAEVLK